MNEFKLVPMEPTPEMLNAPLQGGRFENRVDLRPSIYRAMLAAAPAVQGELVGWQFYKHGKWWNGDILTKNQRKNIEKEGVRVRNVYAEPQLAEQPALDVAQLVEALESAYHLIANHAGEALPERYAQDQMDMITAALAAHRKQGGG